MGLFEVCNAFVMLQDHDRIVIKCFRKAFDHLLHFVQFALQFAHATDDMPISVLDTTKPSLYAPKPILDHVHSPVDTIKSPLDLIESFPDISKAALYRLEHVVQGCFSLLPHTLKDTTSRMRDKWISIRGAQHGARRGAGRRQQG